MEINGFSEGHFSAALANKNLNCFPLFENVPPAKNFFKVVFCGLILGGGGYGKESMHLKVFWGVLFGRALPLRS